MEQREFNSTEASDQMQLPPGFRFHPTDEELITHYLFQKFNDAGFNSLAIGEADLNKCEPWDLPRKSKLGEKDCYFFCVRDRKYPTGLRTNRATDAGYWKATGKDREIFRGKQLVGMKKTLVFYRGRAPRGEKTNWIMHEYRLEGKYAINILVTAAKNEWVLCRVFKKSSVLNGKKPFGMIKMGSLSYGEEGEGAPPPPPPPPPPLTLSPLMNIEAHVPCFSNTMEGQKAHNPDVSSMFFFSKFKPLHTSLYGGSFMSLLEGDGFEVKQLCKEREMLSISQETGLTTDMNTEISSNSEIMRNSFDQFLWNC